MQTRQVSCYVLVLALFLSLCGGFATAQAAEVSVAVVNASSDAPFFIADKRGYFRQEGLTVTFTAFDSGAKMIAPLGAGQLDVGAGGASPGLYNAVERGVEIKIVADKALNTKGYSFQSFLVRKDLIESGAFKSFADLKGRKVAVSAAASSDNSVLNEAIRLGGLAFNDVEKVYMGFPQHAVAYQNKAIDASITTEPTTSHILREGSALRFTTNDTFYPDQQTAVVLYGGQFAKKRPDDAVKFMKAYLRGVRDYNDALKDGKLAGKDAEAIIAILTEYSNIKDAAIYRMMTPNGCNPNGQVNTVSLRKDWQFFKDQGMLNGAVGVDQVLDMSFVEAALKELGPYVPAAK
jgi:NitT/TauT family transport system substrate-binding protein